MKLYLLKIGRFIFKLSFILLITLTLLEVCYRFQIIDFYKTEWTYLNKAITEDNSKSEILVFGDSFSSATNNWINELNNIDSSRIYYNASMPGVATETYRLICKNRVKEVKPKKVIVQLYVGNDLYDIQKPIRWSQFSFSRNLFWKVSNSFRSLNFINYRMGQVSQDVVSDNNPKEEIEFSVSNYSQRTKLYIEALENYPSDILEVKNESVFEELIAHLNEMKAIARVEFYVLLIPHCTQINKKYQENYAQMGATIEERFLTSNIWLDKLSKAQLKVIDPTNHFRELEESKDIKLYYSNDPHLNNTGQKVLANFVKTYFN